MFQSTHPRGVRPRAVQRVLLQQCFNPRTHAGCDIDAALETWQKVVVSIHAPTRGATVKISLEIYNANIIRILSKSRIEWTYIFNH